MAQTDDSADHDERELDRLIRFLTRPELEFALALALFADPGIARQFQREATGAASQRGCHTVSLDLSAEGVECDIAALIVRAAEQGNAVFVTGLDHLLTDSLGRPRHAPALVNFNLRRDELPEMLIGARVVLWVNRRYYVDLASIAWDLLEVTLTRFEFTRVELRPIETFDDAFEPGWLEFVPNEQVLNLRARAEAWAERANSARDTLSAADAAASAGSAFVASGDLEQGQRWLAHAIENYSRIGDSTAVAQQQIRLSSLLRYRGEYDPARQEALSAARTAVAIGNETLETEALQVMADIHRSRGEFESAEPLLEQIARTSEARGDRRNLALALAKLGTAKAVRGTNDSEDLLERAAAIFIELGDEHGWLIARSSLADLRAFQGRLDEAQHIYLTEVLPGLEGQSDVRGLAVIRGRIARIHAAQGEIDRALEILRHEELPSYEQLGDQVSALGTKLLIAELLSRRGDVSEALTLLEGDVIPVARAHHNSRLELFAILQLAHLLELDQRLPDALTQLEAAEQLAKQLQIPLGSAFEDGLRDIRVRIDRT
jgi:tetratricopeptide (TPR) repeat protein